MINIKKLTDQDVGRWVIYETPFKEERGKIKSWNNIWIFVVYKCNNEWDDFMNFTGYATDPKDLSFKED